MYYSSVIFNLLGNRKAICFNNKLVMIMIMNYGFEYQYNVIGFNEPFCHLVDE